MKSEENKEEKVVKRAEGSEEGGISVGENERRVKKVKPKLRN